ncbi:hypothetical protein HPP92_002269 [Vanilla planifolia]|uniref:RING-type E3 ubiquitin transferase n=1 Tax=Vanilla planifolia TaxID=51239 RepID=A0A835SDG8_VANPL|nr:hypothetical protein HPP92_002269 [Vanilla planifolia]
MSTGSPQAWPPRDCSLQYCSIYCPQWCYFYFRPPPPPSTSSSFALSPLLVAIIVVLSCAFFAVAAYLAASKNCYRRRASAAAAAPAPSVSRRHNPSSGLDDSVISKLTTYRYRSGANRDGDCSVCLGEFRDGESVRLLPKCCHSFHQSCIDMWLKSHSSCPLCRAGVVEVIITVAEETGTANEAVALGRGSEGERREEVATEIGEEGGQGGAETAESSTGRSARISV